MKKLMASVLVLMLSTYVWAIDINPKREKKCNEGDAKACKQIGNQYFKAEELDKAKSYYQKSCDLGDEKSCNKLKKLSVDK